MTMQNMKLEQPTLVHGTAGSGKTVFLLSLLDDLIAQEREVWFCDMQMSPTWLNSAMLQLFRQKIVFKTTPPNSLLLLGDESATSLKVGEYIVGELKK